MQPQRVCTLILLSLLYLFSFFNIFLFHFVLREVDVVVHVVAVRNGSIWAMLFVRVPELSSTVFIRADAAAPMLYSAGSY